MSYYDFGDYYRGTKLYRSSVGNHYSEMIFEFDVTGELIGQQVYAYVKWDGEYKLVKSGIAPIHVSSLYHYSGSYKWRSGCYILITTSPIEELNIKNEDWWYIPYSSELTGIVPVCKEYREGDRIFMQDYSICSSSSDSCHHTESVSYVIDGVWHGGERYQNHSGSYSEILTIPSGNHVITYAFDSLGTANRLYTLGQSGINLYDPINGKIRIKNNSGNWVKGLAYTKVEGNWKKAKKVYTKVNGTWQKCK